MATTRLSARMQRTRFSRRCDQCRSISTIYFRAVSPSTLTPRGAPGIPRPPRPHRRAEREAFTHDRAAPRAIPPRPAKRPPATGGSIRRNPGSFRPRTADPSRAPGARRTTDTRLRWSPPFRDDIRSLGEALRTAAICPVMEPCEGFDGLGSCSPPCSSASLARGLPLHLRRPRRLRTALDAPRAKPKRAPPTSPRRRAERTQRRATPPTAPPKSIAEPRRDGPKQPRAKRRRPRPATRLRTPRRVAATNPARRRSPRTRARPPRSPITSRGRGSSSWEIRSPPGRAATKAIYDRDSSKMDIRTSNS